MFNGKLRVGDLVVYRPPIIDRDMAYGRVFRITGRNQESVHLVDVVWLDRTLDCLAEKKFTCRYGFVMVKPQWLRLNLGAMLHNEGDKDGS